MEELQTDEDRRATLGARNAYERALLTNPRFADRPAARDDVRSSASRSSEATARFDVSDPSAPNQPKEAEEPLDWWLVLCGLMALLLSFPVTHTVNERHEQISLILSAWAFTLPTILMAIAIGWFLLRVPLPEFDGDSLFVTVVGAPVLLILGIVGNVLTCGLAVPVAALYVISEANSARRQLSG